MHAYLMWAAGPVRASSSRLQFADESFDLVFESTMLGTLGSKPLLAGIAREMIRVTRKGGHIMLIDWGYSREGSGADDYAPAKALDW